MKFLVIALCAVGAALAVVACEQTEPKTEEAATSESTGSEPPVDTPPPTTTGPKVVPIEEQVGPIVLEKNGEGATADRAPKDGEEVAVLNTTYGRIILMFFPDKAPNHVKRFKDACNKHIFDGVKFHRVIPGFMIQGGDPNSKDDDRSNDGSGGWGDPIKSEFNDVKHVPGILSAARTNDPNSATTQFFLMHGVTPHLNGQYSVYGKVIEGLKVVDTIANLPKDQNDNPLPENPATILKATIVKYPIK